MQKRKLRINILDIAIFIAAICAIATLIFRDTIHEAFGEPEIVVLSVTARADNAEASLKTEFENRTVDFRLDEINGGVIRVTIEETEINPETNAASVLFTCRGYKKLGRYYAENGELLGIGSGCKFAVGDKSVSCVIEAVAKDS